MKFITILILVALFTIRSQSKSQGCSNAGLCTIGDLKNELLTTNSNYLSFSAAYGYGFQKLLL